MDDNRPHLAVVIPAKDVAERITATVRACRALPRVDLIVVVDDGSQDKTQDRARQAGAVAVRHTATRGKASAMETGAKVVGMRDESDRPPRTLVFLDATLGESAAQILPLITPVISGEIDSTVAALPKSAKSSGLGLVTNLSRKAIRRATGWNPQTPFPPARCINRKAFEATMPLAAGWGVETDLPIKLILGGFSIQEIECQLQVSPPRRGLGRTLKLFRRYMDTSKAITNLRMHGMRLPRAKYREFASKQKPGSPYRVPQVRHG